ncbi:hypothetical protein AVEN_77544-1 [Araneus ventricosus]|uniref:Uncharacterized protein n=1 Tax=Araneus ventricosus TaxID=182803 RepID=A0A4Y2PMW6_ARAVE|nr:hypothetical protein AVEN_77544-1 [Araneus ventricosus]
MMWFERWSECGLVEDSGNGGLGLPSCVVAGLNYDEVLFWESRNSWLDCLRYSVEGGDCGASQRNQQLLIWRAQLLMTTERIPMSQRKMDPGISRMHSRVFEKWKPRNFFTCIRERASGGTVVI